MRRKVQHQPNGGSAWGQDQLAHFFHFQTHTRAPWRTRAVGSLGLDERCSTLIVLRLMCPTVRVSAVRRVSSITGAVGFSLSLLTAWRTRAVGSPGLDAFIINQLENKIVYRIARRCA